MINFACRHFRAAKPCIYNKRDGSECPACTHASEYRSRILFIKLDAVGDILRSASLLPAVIAKHDAPYVAWLTRQEAAELVGMFDHVDEVITLSEEALARIAADRWDRVYSLSNDPTSASLAAIARSPEMPVGFYLADGKMTSSNAAALRWLEMAAFDRLKRANTASYQRLMLDILACPDAAIPPPALTIDDALLAAAAARVAELFGDEPRRRVAINIGAGKRWPKKMLTADQIYRLCHLLQSRADIDILLVGGGAETEKATAILALRASGDRIEAVLTGGSVPEFIAILTQMQTLICGDTLALHIATAIDLPTVAVFGPTSPAEIYDFGGLVEKVWTRKLDCLVCYGDCNKARNCMSVLDLEEISELTIRRLEAAGPETSIHRRAL